MSTFDLPAERLPETRSLSPGRNWPGLAAIIAALLLHVSVIVAPLLGWRVTPSKVPSAVPVTLVFEPPPPPPPPPPPKAAVPEPPPPPPPREFAKRESGPDEKTTAPPQADEPGPAATPEPPPGPEAPPQPATEPGPPAGGGKAKQAPVVAHLPEPHRETPVPRAPTPKPRLADRAVGTKEETGDPYLNRLWALIDRGRPPTTPLGPEGLHLAGTTAFNVLIERNGTVSSIRLTQSSGSPVLDREAEHMIANAAPFPPPPPDYPSPTPLNVVISLYPQ